MPDSPSTEDVIYIGTRPRLGLVCITASDEIRFRTITRTRYLQLDPDARATVLAQLYRSNLSKLDEALSFCDRHDIRLYRVSSGLFPFSDEEPGASLLDTLGAEMRHIGERAAHLDIRMIMHPDQFVVLSSDSEQVVQTSIKILEKHARAFDLFGLPRSAWAAMNIHGGKAGRAEKLIEVIGNLPESIASRLTLENDERAYSAAEILAICRRTGVPMVFDNHHFACYEKLPDYDDARVAEMVLAARATWPNPTWQIVHLSNGRESCLDPRHSDFIRDVPGIYAEVPWIEVEAKAKEQAIERLRNDMPEQFGHK